MSSTALRNKFPISQEELFIHEMTTRRLLWYSTHEDTKLLLPKRNFSSRDDNLSTTTIHDRRRDKFPISKKSNSSMRWQVVDYYGTRPPEGQVPYPQEEYFIHEMITYRLLRYSTSGGTSSLSPRRVIHPWDDILSTTTVLDSSWDKISISLEDLFIHEVTIRRLPWLLRYSTQDETNLNSPRGSIHPRDDNTSTTTVLDFKKIQDFYFLKWIPRP